jgi:hypothetical protein
LQTRQGVLQLLRLLLLSVLVLHLVPGNQFEPVAEVAFFPLHLLELLVEFQDGLLVLFVLLLDPLLKLLL